ncbi:alpha-N-acetylglucosaminidase TIM-barrel domain-containing protein [Streptomyces sp. HPF1205]|uniref:alpha-N-acetylglucosaminidase TIM-barrel domain-containing protein n=1 Tax=Streptomyces sp. HPF1205 TaxID=2873262 RepID=UPI001CEDC7E8|nr:alpha-N-acetylglucosaminidase TIM-barrel domain-containing protein [Streptomyces sp. HPF1205]
MFSALMTAALPAAAATAKPTGPAPRSAAGTSVARAAITRLVGPALAGQLDLRELDAGSGQDRYRIEAADGRTRISGTTPGTILAGFGQYLRVVAHADISLNGEQLRLPARLPLPTSPVVRSAAVPHRFALNDTNEGYAGAYLDWPQWQRRIDVLALNGINEVLVHEGQEAVYDETFQRFGYTDGELRAWIPQPGHQPWWLLQNMCCLDGPISRRLMDRRVALGQHMTGYLRQLGLTPVLPGYFGTVPPEFAARNPGAHVVAQGTWNGFARSDWLDPTSALFDQVADTFYRRQSALFGDSAMYKMDLLHEGGRPGDVDIGDASRAVQNALERAHPGAIWAVLGWQSNPRPQTLRAVDTSRVLVLDGNSDTTAATDRDQDWLGAPYAFGTIWNFGGSTGMGASMSLWNEKFHAWLAKPGTALRGIALMPEAIDNNPVAAEFFTDLAWEPAPVDMDTWMAGYATARYGAADPDAVAAWQTLGRTVYSWPGNSQTRYAGSLFSVQPGLWASAGSVPYDPRDIVRAFDDLLRVGPGLRGSTAYGHDVVDLGRQVLSDDTKALLPAIRQAYLARDTVSFDALTGQWTAELDLMDRLLGTDATSLFGVWQKEAAAEAATAAEARRLEYDVRTLVSDWSEEHPIQDYAGREWNGLVGDYYGTRWRAFFASLRTSLRTGDDPGAIDWHAVASTWVHQDTRYPSTPVGDSYAVAQEVAAYPRGHLVPSADPKAAPPGATVRITAAFTNDNTLRPAGAARFALTAPPGYGVHPVDVSAAPVAPGATATGAWDVTVPAGAAPADLAHLTATVRWSAGGRTASASGTTDVMVTGPPVAEPYRTAASAPVAAAQRGDVFALAGGGADVGGSKDEYGTVYRSRWLASGQAVATAVVDQEDSGPWARAGLVVRSDLSRPGSPGYAILAVTPGHGCDFMWDADGDGTLDHYTTSGGFTGPVRLRISRDGDTFTGWCGQDGGDWAEVGSARLPGATDAEDAGLLFTAVDAATHRLGAARFDGLAVTPFTPRDTSGDTVLSLGRPTAALSSEAGTPPSAAVDGDRTDKAYWGSPLSGGYTWWQVDLGAQHELSSVDVRPYVDGKRAYTYTLEGSTDGVHWFVLGGKNTSAVATDAGDAFTLEAAARYVRVVGLSNTANSSFHLTEVTVTGAPA